jgi:Tol biopolymer transport system component
MLALPQAQVLNGFNWTTDGKLLLSDSASLVRTDADGNNRTTLLAEAGIGEPSACGTRNLVFPWMLRHGSNATHIWRTDANGGNPVQLTDGKRDYSPVCSADLKWVYYVNGDANQNWRVPLDGGKSELVPGSIVPNSLGAAGFSISPDGKVATFETTVSTGGPTVAYGEKIALLNLGSEGPTTPRLLDVDQRISGLAKFTPDGEAVAYLITDKGVDNIWMQLLNGSAGRQITSFKSDRISEFHWSPDGKILGVLQYHADSDVVLIRDKGSLPQ